MSENSFEAFNTTNSGFENPFPGSTTDSSNPFADEKSEAGDPSVTVAEPKKRGRKKKEVVEGEEVEAGPKREMAPRLTAEQKTHIVRNYATSGPDKVAEELGINLSQIRNTISGFRKDMLKRIEEAKSDEEKEKYNKFIETFLPKHLSAGGTKKREKKAGNQSIIDDLLKDLLV